jgi:endonuclease-8
MPEGHTLHRLARLHQQRFGKAPVLVTSPQGRFAEAAAAVSGRVLRKADAWGKHLFHHYEGGAVVHVHLGLYGTFTERPVPMPAPVGQVRMRMVGEEYGADLRGPTACEVIHGAEVDEIVARLGPDPLRRAPDPAPAWKRISKSRRPIGALLMDQAVIAGVGNVYRSELLYRHLIDPHRPGTHDEDWCANRQDRHRQAARRQRRTVVPGGPAPNLRLPTGRRPVSGVWHADPHRGHGGAQPLLVSDLPGVGLWHSAHGAIVRVGGTVSATSTAAG